MTIEFLPLLTLEAAHGYYGGRCPDLAFRVLPSTASALAGARTLAKIRDDRLHLLFERREGGGAFEPMASLARRTLRFGLKVVDPAFGNFTELPLVAEGGLPLYRNASNPRSLQAPAGLLLDPRHPDDAEIVRQGLLCLVEIAVDAGFYAAPPAFAVPFQARAETLRYYVVARNYTQTEFGQLDVSDAGFTADARPQIRFTRVAPSGFTPAEIPAAQLGGAGTRVALWRSQQPVARRSKARTRIQLARNNDVIVAQLPQPGAAAATADLVVHLSK